MNTEYIADLIADNSKMEMADNAAITTGDHSHDFMEDTAGNKIEMEGWE